MTSIAKPGQLKQSSEVSPRLMIPAALCGRLNLQTERDLGLYRPVGDDPIARVAAAGLRGRGGAGFPAHIKWQAVATGVGNKTVVANGEEGEPLSQKDAWLLTHRPHLVLDGLLIAAAAVGASRTIVYLSHPETIEPVRAAIAELETAGILHSPSAIEVHIVAPTYVAGEETAVCRSINGGPALPTAKPPRPFEKGVDGGPTLVTNVETLAHASWILRNSAAAYRAVGTAESPGTTLVTLNGACRRHGVYEIPFGISLEEAFETYAGGFTSAPRGFAVGGWFGGLLSSTHADLTCDFESFNKVGSSWGCGAMEALGADADVIAYVGDLAQWYERESAGQCGVCVKGTAAIAATLQRLRDGSASQQDIDNLVRWGGSLVGRGGCAYLDGAARLARTTVSEFEADVVRGIE